MRTWLIQLRNKEGFSQAETARRAGIAQGYYAAIETGSRGNPLNVNTAKRIAAVIGFDWQKFYEEDA